MINNFFLYEKCEDTGKYSMPKGHIHRYNEIYYLSRGVRRYFIDGEIYNLRSGDVVFIPKNTIHHTTSLSDANYERYLLNFSDDYFPAELQAHFKKILTCRHFSLNLDEQEEILHLLEKIRIARKRKDDYTDTLCRAYMAELLVMLSYAKQAHSRQTDTKTQTEQTIADARQYLHRHLSAPLTLSLPKPPDAITGISSQKMIVLSIMTRIKSEALPARMFIDVSTPKQSGSEHSTSHPAALCIKACNSRLKTAFIWSQLLPLQRVRFPAQG